MTRVAKVLPAAMATRAGRAVRSSIGDTLFLVCVAAVTVGCATTNRKIHGPAVAPSDIVILGDSIADQSRTAIEITLPGVRLDALSGRTVARPGLGDAAVDLIAALKEPTPPRWWVIELGTNDSSAVDVPDDRNRDEIAYLLGEIGDDVCVLWVLPSLGPAADGGWRERADHFGVLARLELDRRTCATSVSWERVVSNEPDVLGPDGVHPTAEGQQRLAELIRAELVNAGALAVSPSGTVTSLAG